MAFGITKSELNSWKKKVLAGEIAFLTHYWYDDRFSQYKTVTKVGCANIEKLQRWGQRYHLSPQWIDPHPHFPHYDLFGEYERVILLENGLHPQYMRFYDQIERPLRAFTYDLYRHSPYKRHIPLRGSVLDGEAPMIEKVMLHYFRQIFQPTDFIRVVAYIEMNDHRPPYDRTRLADFVKTDSLCQHLTSRRCIDNQSIIQRWESVQTTVAQLDYRRLLQRRIMFDFSNYWRRSLHRPTFFIEHEESGIVFHPYDDRGIELIANDQQMYRVIQQLSSEK